MRVAISGASGLVGSALQRLLSHKGHRVVTLVRDSPTSKGEVLWNTHDGLRDPAALDKVDGVVHLAGENIAGGRWTASRKREIRRSRIEGTRLLAEGLAGLATPPEVLACASAIGFYGNRGEERLTEDSDSGTGFLAETCREWEAAADPAREAGLRVVHMRFGIVLSPEGGALDKMLLPFKLGLGGRIGGGDQYWSWIALDDVVRAIEHCLLDDNLVGPVNVVSPEPVTNAEFTRALGGTLSRPTVFPMPAFAARLALGEMADEMLLASQRVMPGRLHDSGFAWELPELRPALEHLLGS